MCSHISWTEQSALPGHSICEIQPSPALLTKQLLEKREHVMEHRLSHNKKPGTLKCRVSRLERAVRQPRVSSRGRKAVKPGGQLFPRLSLIGLSFHNHTSELRERGNASAVCPFQPGLI